MNEKQIKWAVVRFILTLVVAVGLVIWITVREGSVARELQDGLVAACEDSGNPLRAGLREEKEIEIHEAKHPEAQILEALHLTEEQAIELAQPRIEKLERDIRVRYAPLDCHKQIGE